MVDNIYYSTRKIQDAWRVYTDRQSLSILKKDLKEKLQCCVCFDHHISFNRCTNNHGVCELCFENLQDNSCPLCRNTLGEVAETLVCHFASTLNLQIKCCTCNQEIPVKEIEKHRNWCEEYLFCCPEREFCTKQFRAKDLYNHVLHHDRNIIRLNNTSETIFTHINSHDNYIIICLEEMNYVVVISWSNNRADYGRGLIHLTAKCYYPTKLSPALNVTISQYDMLKQVETPVEIFNIANIEPVLPSKEDNSINSVPNCVITPLFNFIEPPSQPAVIEIIKHKTDISTIKRRVKRDITYCDTRKYKYTSYIKYLMNRESTAFIGINFTLSNIPISKIYI